MGQLFKTKIIGFDENFKGIIEFNNKKYSIKNTIQDEIIEFDVNNKNDPTFIIKKIEKPSIKRTEPKCPIFFKCGGCQLLHIKYDEQLKMKKNICIELFKSININALIVQDVVGMDNPFNYRNKNQLVFYQVKGKLISGFYEEGTHNIINNDKCLVQDKTANEILVSIRELMLKFKISAYDEDRKNGLLRHVIIKRSNSTKQLMIVLVVSNDIFPGRNNFVKALVSRHKEITTIVQNVNNRSTSVILGDKEVILYGKGFIKDILLGKKFNISSKSFYQINPTQTEKLYSLALNSLNLKSSDVVLDAYCGVGTIGIIASSNVKKVIGVEIVKDAIKNGIVNAKENNISNISFYCDDASNFMLNLVRKKEKIDVVIIDPPRKGCDDNFISSLLKLKPSKILYISCNPYTQIVDLKQMIHDYSVTYVQPVDMFPHSSHIECIVSLERRFE